MPTPASSATACVGRGRCVGRGGGGEHRAPGQDRQRVGGGGGQRRDEGAPWLRHLLVGLAAQAHPERGPQRAQADPGEHRRADQPDGDAQRVDRQQPPGPERAERGVGRVDHGGACADRQPARGRAAQRRADQQQRDRPDRRRDGEAETEADERRCGHGADRARRPALRPAGAPGPQPATSSSSRSAASGVQRPVAASRRVRSRTPSSASFASEPASISSQNSSVSAASRSWSCSAACSFVSPDGAKRLHHAPVGLCSPRRHAGFLVPGARARETGCMWRT